MAKTCYHCGKKCEDEIHAIDKKYFCCNGCKTVYRILNENDLSHFYSLNKSPGVTPDKKNLEQFDFLDTKKVFDKIVDFYDEDYTVVTFFVPVIHCSSCIWLLESLPKIHEHINRSQVNFTRKTITITYKSRDYPLSELAKFLTELGYKPIISLESSSDKQKKYVDRRLLLQLAVAFFAAGNTMLLAFPGYVGGDGKWLISGGFRPFFGWTMLILTLPVVFFSAQDYLKSAFKGLEHNNYNIDLPVSIGILTLFGRSVYEVVNNVGFGYFESLSGFVFFLLLGKYFQQNTYKYLSFDRDYKSFYPIAVTKIADTQEKNIILSDLKKGDRLLIRNEEIIPADAILIKGEANINNSFITGESQLIKKRSGDKIFAGGKQLGSAIEIEVIKEVDQSYLTKLWNNEAFKKKDSFKIIIDKISAKFTLVILSIAMISGIAWWFIAPSRMFEIVTSVLIVACPCALALSAPFIFGHMMRLMAKRGFYVKDTATVENMAGIKHIVFDKTGTITENESAKVTFVGEPLSEKEKAAVKSMVKNSAHPLSHIIYKALKNYESLIVEQYEEFPGEGIRAFIQGQQWKLGSSLFVRNIVDSPINQTKVYLKTEHKIRGYFKIENQYRKSLSQVIKTLSKRFHLSILSGDNEAEKENLIKITFSKSPLLFNQKPHDKLNYIKKIQKNGEKVMMIGDGLNDSGALKQSNVGISISENINRFSPSCDAILKGTSFEMLPLLLRFSKIAKRLLKISFLISFLYNIIGLAFAVSGHLSPLVAAVLMPLSSISIVIFASISTYVVGKIEKTK